MTHMNVTVQKTYLKLLTASAQLFKVLKISFHCAINIRLMDTK